VYVAPFSYDTAFRRPTCSGGNDGMIRLKVTNCGRAPIKYNWENTGYTTTDSLSNISQGTYRVVVTDSSNVYHDTLTFQLTPFQIAIDTTGQIVQNPRCFGQKTAIIQLKPITGKMPYRFNWFDGRGYIFNSSIGGLGAGQYSVDIIDSNQCHGSFTFNVTAPPLLTVSVDTFNVSCFGKSDGMAVALAAGGSGKYSYNWQTGAVSDTAVGLAAGQYNLTVLDSLGCIANSGVLITSPPQLLIDTFRVKPSRCFGDSTAAIYLDGVGGTPPYKYSIDGVHFQRDTAFVNIPGGTYTATIRDSTGCKVSEVIVAPQPAQIQVSAGPDVDLNLGFSTNLRAIVVPSKGVYKYLWSPPDSLSCVTCPEVMVHPIKTTQ